MEVERAGRETENAKKIYDILAEKYEAALLARAEGDQNFRLGGRAVLPLAPVRPRPLLNTAVASMVGLVLSIGLVLLLEYLQSDPLSREARQISSSKEGYVQVSSS